MNLFVLFGVGAITRKKKKKEANFASYSFPSIFFSGDTPSRNKKKKKINSFLNTLVIFVTLFQ
jgi:hypothetical protein